MSYQIEYRYSTGDSFGSSDEEGILDYEWENLENAKENLQRIKEHYKMYQEIENVGKYSNKDKRDACEILDSYQDKDWFAVIEKKPWYPYGNKGELMRIDINPKKHEESKIVWKHDISMTQCCLRLKLDNGNFVQFWPSWIGYFESLYGAKVISKSPVDNDLEFEI